MIIEEAAYLEHHGVKGQKWGIRKAEDVAKSIGRGSWAAAKMIGRGTKKTYRFSKDHPKFVASVAAGAMAAGLILTHNKNVKLKTIKMNQRNFNYAKGLLNEKKDIRIQELSTYLHSPGSATMRSEAASRAMHEIVKNHRTNLINLAKEFNIDPKTALKDIY